MGAMVSTWGAEESNHGQGCRSLQTDYLIWDDQAGLTGFLNQRTWREGVPLYIYQGPPKTIADGITQDPSSIRLADMDGFVAPNIFPALL